jgi:hypothetical protein
MLVIVSALISGAGSSLLRAAMPYCAFEIKVIRPSGLAADKIAAGISKDGHALSESLTDSRGIARICDAPVGPVDVFAGFAPCDFVTVHSVKPFWLRTKTVTVVYDGSSCSEFSPAPTACHFLLRVRDESGRPVEGAEFRENGAFAPGVAAISDQFGRLFRVIDNAGILQGAVTKKGYDAAAFARQCDVMSESVDVDATVTLHRR